MKKYTIYSLLLGILTLFSNCESFIDGHEVSPNQATDAPLETIVRSALIASIVEHEGEDARLSAMWSQQFTGSDRQYSGFNVYNINAEDFDWDPVYYGCIQQAAIAIEKAQVTDNRVLIGIMKVTQAHMFGVVASLWGDIPFSEANQFFEIPNPSYDAQASVYQGVQALLDEAIADLENGKGSDLDADFLLEGDPAKWIAVAYTLKARFYVHVKDYPNAIVAAERGIADPANNLLALHGPSYNQDLNLWNSFIEEDRVAYLDANGAFMPQLLDENQAIYRGNAKTDESARFAFIYTPATTAGATNYGINTSETGIYAPAASYPMVTYEENQLILAEAKLRGGDASGALGHLNNVRQLHATTFGTTYDDYVLTDFEAAGIAGISGASQEDALLMEIVEEKYITLVGQIEVFCDIRRTDNMIGLVPTSGSMLPQRFIYPQDEINANTSIPTPVPDIFVPTPINQ